MARRIVLAGHCGPDSSYLRLAVMQAVKDAQVLSADDESALSRLVDEGVDLILFNRELGYGFKDNLGVDAIRRLQSTSPDTRAMLVSNYPDAQAAAVAAGALPGFGKREIGSKRVVEVLRHALGEK